MRAPAFWWKPAPDPLAHLLSPAAALYGAIAARRMDRPGEGVGAPVICVGNFVAGGAGKTPTAIAIARELLKAGATPFFLSRGYGASRPTGAPLLVDLRRHGAAEAGDEPLLLARVAPTVVCADRVAGARFALAQGAGAIVMDDGLQNPSLRKDVRIAVVDGAVGVGNGLCMPAGPLRAPLDAQLAQVDAVVVIGEGGAGAGVAALAKARNIAVGRARLSPDAQAAASLRGQRVLAFAGIGRPEKFFDTLGETGAQVAARRAFPDHHAFTAQELSGLREEAARLGARLVTTEKDAARIGEARMGEAHMVEAGDITALPVSLVFEDEGFPGALALRALR